MFTARHNQHHFRPCQWLPIVLLLLSITSTALSALVNVTVDDQTGDSRTGAIPTYSPAANWTQGSTCTYCLAKPDPKYAFHGTWHDSTSALGNSEYTITYTFSGSAVYAFFVMANYNSSVTTSTNLSFTIDGKLEGSYTHTPDGITNYAYNVTAFSKSGLSDGQHEIVISNNAGVNASLALFDYLIYTIEDDSDSGSGNSSPSAGSSQNAHANTNSIPSDSTGEDNTYPVSSNPYTSESSDEDSTSSSPNLGAIIGGVSAGVAVVAIILFVLLYARNKRRRGQWSFSTGRVESKAEHPADVAASAALVEDVDYRDGDTNEARWRSGPGILASIRRFSMSSRQQVDAGSDQAQAGSAARNTETREKKKYYSRRQPMSPEHKNKNTLGAYYNADHGMSRMSLLPQFPHGRLQMYATELPPTPPMPTSPLPPLPPAGAKAEVEEGLEEEEMFPEFIPPGHLPPTVPSSPVPSSTLEPPGLMSKWSDDSLRPSTDTREGAPGLNGQGRSHRHLHLHRPHLHLHHHHSKSEGRDPQASSHTRPWRHIHSSSSGQQQASSRSSSPPRRRVDSASGQISISQASLSPRQSPALRPKQRLSPNPNPSPGLSPNLNSNLNLHPVSNLNPKSSLGLSGTERRHHWQAKQQHPVHKILPNPDGALITSRRHHGERIPRSRPFTAPTSTGSGSRNSNGVIAAGALQVTSKRRWTGDDRRSYLNNAYLHHPYAQPQIQALGHRRDTAADSSWINDDVSVYVRRDGPDSSPRYYI